MISEYRNIGENCKIGENVNFLGNVDIGDNCKIGNNVCLNSVHIDHNSVIQDNSIIGYDTITGHYYEQEKMKKSKKIEVKEIIRNFFIFKIVYHHSPKCNDLDPIPFP